MDLDTLKQFMPVIDTYPRPDWESIDNLISDLPVSEAHAAWFHAGRMWMEETARHLGRDYKVDETDNFFLLTGLNERHRKLLKAFVEKALTRILTMLDGIANDEGNGKHVAIIFDNQDDYYDYVTYFMPNEGEYPLSGGMFLHGPYGHFVMPYYDFADMEATIAHEMTHACLRHLPIPLWLNEGLAVSIEHELCGNHPLRMDSERMVEHHGFWNQETIQEFWSGTSFSHTDEGIGLSYELARYCVRALAHDFDEFVEFSNQASYEDGGETAAVNTYKASLGGLIHQFFGPGDWSPNPETW